MLLTPRRALAAVPALALVALFCACNSGSGDPAAATAKTAAAAPKKPAGPAAFAIDPSLTPQCKSNVEWLVACAKRVGGADGDDLMKRAKTMQTSYLEIKPPSAADTRCKELSSIVRSNPRCK